MLVTDFDYPLPPHSIAQHPGEARDSSRLLVVHRENRQLQLEHRRFNELGSFLRRGDLLVVNDSRVIPARLRGFKPGTGGSFELLLLEETAPSHWWVLFRPAKRVRPGTALHFSGRDGAPIALKAEVIGKNTEGHVLLCFNGDVLAAAEAHGEIPLPPYIHRPAGPSCARDRERYQTVYARSPGSVAAPTAGLHLTASMLAGLETIGVGFCSVTLHVGAGTFLPVKAVHLADHQMHEERFTLPAATAAAINSTKTAGHRVIAVGTTTLRVLESVARGGEGTLWGGAPDETVPTGFRPLPEVVSGRTRIFIHPPYRFRVVDALVTNFHLPQSTLLMLASAFAAPGEEAAGRKLILAAYATAVREEYRFFSYGDAMLLL